jgi:hypothetical protein
MDWIKGKRPPKVAEETLRSIWLLPSFTKDERPDHPTPKPLDAFGIPMRQHVARSGLWRGIGRHRWPTTVANRVLATEKRPT